LRHCFFALCRFRLRRISPDDAAAAIADDFRCYAADYFRHAAFASAIAAFAYRFRLPLMPFSCQLPRRQRRHAFAMLRRHFRHCRHYTPFRHFHAAVAFDARLLLFSFSQMAFLPLFAF